MATQPADKYVAYERQFQENQAKEFTYPIDNKHLYI